MHNNRLINKAEFKLARMPLLTAMLDGCWYIVFMLGLTFYLLFRDGVSGSVLVPIGILVFYLALSFKRYLEGGAVWITLSEDGITLPTGYQYQWEEVQSVQLLELNPSVYGAATPGFQINFTDGKEYKITQRVDDYTRLYKQLFDRNIDGTATPLPVYEVDKLAGGAAELLPKPKFIFYPKENKNVAVKIK